MTRQKFWRDTRVMVTGATGLLGAWLIKRLLELDAFVLAVIRDRVPRSHLYRSGAYADVTMVHGCLEDYPLVERSLNEYEIDTVFHLGAQTIVGTANRSPLSTFEANIRGTWHVLEACRNHRSVRRILVASSDKAYGSHPDLPYMEETPLRGEHPYDVSKSCADLITQSYFKTYGLPVCITRCGNMYGGGDLNFNRLIPGTIRAVLRNEVPVVRSDGTFVRDYIYVEDVVTGCLLVLEQMEAKQLAGEAFNFSNETPIGVLDLVNLITGIMGVSVEPRVMDEVTGEIRSQHLSSRKARRVLGWKPNHDLRAGLEKTIKHYREFFSVGPTLREVRK